MYRWTENGWVLCSADDEAGDGKPGGGSGGASDAGSGGNSGQDGGKTFTQAEIDKIVGDRLTRDRKERDKTAADEKRKAEMSEAEKLKAAKDDADARSTAADERANAVTVKAEAKVSLLAAGVKSERLAASLKLMDLSGVTVTEGEPDAAALKKAVDALLKEYPEFVGEAKANAGGKEFGGGGKGGKFDMNSAIRQMAGRS